MVSKKERSIMDYYNKEVLVYNNILKELGNKKFEEFISLYRRTELGKYYSFAKFYQAFIEELEEENNKTSISSFKKFLIKRNTEFALGEYAWVEEVGLIGEYLN